MSPWMLISQREIVMMMTTAPWQVPRQEMIILRTLRPMVKMRSQPWICQKEKVMGMVTLQLRIRVESEGEMIPHLQQDLPTPQFQEGKPRKVKSGHLTLPSCHHHRNALVAIEELDLPLYSTMGSLKFIVF